VVAFSAFALVALGAEAGAEPRHGLSAFGDLKYGADFTRFDYVNPDAPKGGTFSLVGWQGSTTFNSLNNFILKGDAAQGLELTFDSLMARAEDEPDAVYALVAKSADLAEDGRSVTFALREEARFSDGSPITADDVAFSFEILKTEGHPIYRQILRDVESAEVLGPHALRYRFTGDLVRDLPMTVAALPIFSRKYYETRDFAATTLEPPLGSGPYTIEDFSQGRFITYRRNDDYWGKDLPVNRGRWNFDTIRFEYFRDRTAGMEAFKAGAYDFREEFTSKVWATEYNFPAIRDGRVKRETLDDLTPSGTQGFFLNTRRPQLADEKVRAALALTFDFEWTNQNIFYGLYKRTHSYFENSPMKAGGAPGADEQALLKAVGVSDPEILESEAVMPPVTKGDGNNRSALRAALKLLNEAGYEVKNGRMVDGQGRPLEIEFLMFEPSFERVIAPYIRNLSRLGISANMRIVDPAQYEQRVKAFDFDITTRRYVMRSTPGVELQSYFSSNAAKTAGSLNLSGIADPAVDALIERVIAARDRESLTLAAKALDRVLRAGHYWVPHWYKASHTIAYWDRFSRPEKKPDYDRGILDTWWYDEEKARKLDGR
jgi:microcin C transport system substrate-binding protein